MNTLYELKIPAQPGLERLRVKKLNRKIRELNASVTAIAESLRRVIFEDAIFKGEDLIDQARTLGVILEGSAQAYLDDRMEKAAERRNRVLAETGRDTKKRWASYFLHPEGGICDRLRTPETARHSLSAAQQESVPIEVVAAELRTMESIGLLWGSGDHFALTVSGVRFVRLNGFPRWLTKRRAWLALAGAGGWVLVLLSVVADVFGVAGCSPLMGA